MTPGMEDEPLGGVDFSRLSGGTAGDALRLFATRLTEERPTSGDDPSEGKPSGDGSSRGNPLEESHPGVGFLLRGAEFVRRELLDRYESDPTFRKRVDEAAKTIAERSPVRWEPEVREAVWSVFFPEGAGMLENVRTRIQALRERRVVTVDTLNPEPITDPVAEILFTSNVLITVPSDPSVIETLPQGAELKKRIRATMDEVQLYYYDHPIHIGVENANNEAIYGMRGLNDAIAWEKRAGRVAPDQKAAVVLSLSVTHEGLRTVAREYLEEEFARGGPFEHLEIYLFSEIEARRIVDSVLTEWLPQAEIPAVLDIFGVDGEYGRHYSFLKAIAAFWNVFIDERIRGTFKIDLDQVFPQDQLKEETGESALEHFTTPLWGATGNDTDGNAVELGMIAGALVNEKDIHRGVFTPDVPFPDEIPPGEAAVFYNRIPMALSTEAEMMTRYEPEDPNAPPDSAPAIDGRSRCIQRYHVTGGTNGILVAHLRKHCPFTPTFVGRAEDQAYLLSVLFNGANPVLRYVHKPGLIMRHDKEAFAGESIKAATHGRFIGDLARTWIYSRYAASTPWGLTKTKEQIDPFTGCFATTIPFTVIYLRLALYCASILHSSPKSEQSVLDVLELASRKLSDLFEGEKDGFIGVEYRRQQKAWGNFYDALTGAEGDRDSDGAGRQSWERARRNALDIVSHARVVG
jgi:hypothetical protein